MKQLVPQEDARDVKARERRCHIRVRKKSLAAPHRIPIDGDEIRLRKGRKEYLSAAGRCVLRADFHTEMLRCAYGRQRGILCLARRTEKVCLLRTAAVRPLHQDAFFIVCELIPQQLPRERVPPVVHGHDLRHVPHHRPDGIDLLLRIRLIRRRF